MSGEAIAALPAPARTRFAERPYGFRAAGPPPHVFGAPSFGSDSELYADTCTAVSTCWAVGFYVNNGTARLGQALQFNGSSWTQFPVPRPGGFGAAAYNYLTGVTCTSSANCWIVGYHSNRAGASLNEALHWNGTNWRSVAMPQPAGHQGSSDRNELTAVTCMGRGDCWAVGDYTNKAGRSLNEALHWQGAKWKSVPVPNANGIGAGDQNVPYSIACASTSDCLSVGYGHTSAGAYVNEALRWNGRKWSIASIPQPGGTKAHDYGYLAGLACPSAHDCWADGGYRNSAGAYVNEALRWNGHGWTGTATPDPGGRSADDANELVGLSCTSASDCWAVGYYFNSARAELNDAIHWDGLKWSQVVTPQPAGISSNSQGNTLYGVSCVSPAYCVAVGYTYKTGARSSNQVLLWDGTSWSVG